MKLSMWQRLLRWMCKAAILISLQREAKADFWIERLKLSAARPGKGHIGLTHGGYWLSEPRQGFEFNQKRFFRVYTNLDLRLNSFEWLTLFTHLRFGYDRFDDLLTGDHVSLFSPLDQTVGFSVHLLEQAHTGLFLQVQADMPLYDSPTRAHLLYPGDGSFDFTGSLFAYLKLHDGRDHSLKINGGAGFTWRTMNYSSAIPWQASIRFEPIESRAHGLLLGIFGGGTLSLRTDTGAVGNKVFHQGTLLGAPGAMNPAQTLMGGEVGYRFEGGSEILLQGSFPIWVTNLPKGIHAQIIWQLPWALHHRVHPHEEKVEGRFINYALDARVVSAQEHFNLVKLDRGSADNINLDDTFDFFTPDGTRRLGHGHVTHLRLTEAIVEIDGYTGNDWVTKDCTARKRTAFREEKHAFPFF